MTAIEQLRRLWAHAAWADLELMRALFASPSTPAEAIREYAHVLGAEELWLSRLEARAPRAAIWPELDHAALATLSDDLRRGYNSYLDSLYEGALDKTVKYTNSAGKTFSTPVGEILLHVALHGQYHRGKVNLLLRQTGLAPAPTDFIAFVRGAPAATKGDPRRAGG